MNWRKQKIIFDKLYRCIYCGESRCKHLCVMINLITAHFSDWILIWKNWGRLSCQPLKGKQTSETEAEQRRFQVWWAIWVCTYCLVESFFVFVMHQINTISSHIHCIFEDDWPISVFIEHVLEMDICEDAYYDITDLPRFLCYQWWSNSKFLILGLEKQNPKGVLEHFIFVDVM